MKMIEGRGQTKDEAMAELRLNSAKLCASLATKDFHVRFASPKIYKLPVCDMEVEWKITQEYEVYYD